MWLVFYKKHSDVPTIQYSEAVEGIAVAKRQETKERRIEESIALLQQGKRLGLK